jgi:hypothetical protein
MPLKGKKDGVWSDASAVYGKSGGEWLYAKESWAKKDGVWQRSWTDCRQHDAGGRDWAAAAGVTEYQGSCTTRESRVRTDYSKTGCTGYSRYTSWVAAPTCAGACTTAKTGNFTQDGLEYYYSGTAGYYEAFIDGGTGNSGGCGILCPTGFYNYGYYYIETCGGTNYIQTLYCIGCQSYFG